MALSNKKLASGLILKIRELNTRMAADQFAMAQLLYTLNTGKMHLHFGYTDFIEFCDHELSCTPSAAYVSIKMFKDAKRLKYNKSELIEMLERIGITRTRNSLAAMREKQSISKVEKTYGKSSNTLTVHLTRNEMRDVEKKLIKYGLDVNKNGKRTNMRQTLLTLIKAA